MNPINTLVGRQSILVTLGDGSSEKVDVLALPIRMMEDLYAAQNNEAALVALYCGQPIEWTDRLSHASVEQIIKVGEEMNSGFFERWLGRTSRRLEPLVERIKGIAEAEASRNGSATVRSPAD